MHRSVKKPEIILFGSRLLGTARPDSDVDLVVVSESFHGIGLSERRKLLADSVAELNWRSIDIVKRSPAEWAREAWLKNTIESQVNEKDQWRELIERYGRWATLEVVNEKRRTSNALWRMEEVAEELAADLRQPPACPRCNSLMQGGCRRSCAQCGFTESCGG